MGPENEGYAYREQLGREAAGRTTLDYLAARYNHSPREAWLARLEAGEVELDGRRAGAGDVLREGQVLVWHRPPWVEPEVPLHFDVLHEDADILVVNKPSGLPTLPGGGFLMHTLQSLVQRRDAAWAAMHRLGRGTSGLVVFARTPAARAALGAAFRSRTLDKHYLALAEGALEPRPIRAPIGKVAHPLLGQLWAAAPGGRPSESIVERVAPRPDASLAQVRLVTGRPHQIRIHLAWAGHPLVGDPLYGPGGVPRGGLPALPGDLGYHLHAWRLAFTHPATGVRLALEAPVPPALR